MRFLKHLLKDKSSFWGNWTIAVSIVLLTGVFYRHQASSLDVLLAKKVKLPISLRAFPREVNGWIGQNVPIAQSIQRVAGNDDYINRFYRSESGNQWANVYVAYSGRPRTMLGHSPQTCYVAAGWIHLSTERSNFTSADGKLVPCMIHRFTTPVPDNEQIVLLNFYILNGRTACSERGFSAIAWRTPNIAGDPARYVAQIQISSSLENAVRAAARDIAPSLYSFFPDEDGNVKAAEFAQVLPPEKAVQKAQENPKPR